MNSKKSKNFIFLFFLCGILFVQIGYSSLISFQFLMFASLLTMAGVRPLVKNFNLIVFCFIAIFIGQIFHYKNEIWLGALLRASREFMSLGLMICAKDIRWDLNYLQPKIKTGIKFLIFAIFIMVALQFIAFNYYKASLFFLPYSIYPAENVSSIDSCGVMPSCWINFVGNREIDLFIRPVAFYSEPSYLGFIILSIFMVGHNIFSGRSYGYFVAVLCAILAISKTASGLLSFFALFVCLNRDYLLKNKSKGALLVFGAACLVLLLSFDRIFNIGNKNAELSGYVRLVLPFLYIKEVLLSGNIFGVPLIYFRDFISNKGMAASVGVSLDNAILNLFIFYGVMALAIILCFVKKYKLNFLLFIFLCGMFNGGLFTYDKAFIISMTIVLCNGLERVKLYEAQRRGGL